MIELDDIARRDRRVWNHLVALGGGYTIPWLNLDREALRAFAEMDTR